MSEFEEEGQPRTPSRAPSGSSERTRRTHRAAASLRAGEEGDAAAEMERLARVLRALEATAGEHLALRRGGTTKAVKNLVMSRRNENDDL